MNLNIILYMYRSHCGGCLLLSQKWTLLPGSVESIIPDSAAVPAPGRCTLEGAALGFLRFVLWVLAFACQFLVTWRL